MRDLELTALQHLAEHGDSSDEEHGKEKCEDIRARDVRVDAPTNPRRRAEAATAQDIRLKKLL